MDSQDQRGGRKKLVETLLHHPGTTPDPIAPRARSAGRGAFVVMGESSDPCGERWRRSSGSIDLSSALRFKSRSDYGQNKRLIFTFKQFTGELNEKRRINEYEASSVS